MKSQHFVKVSTPAGIFSGVKSQVILERRKGLESHEL